MTDQEDYQNRRDAIASIPPADIKRSTIPIDVYLQEAENLAHWARRDFEQLNKAGLSRERLDELPIRVGLLREAEARWQAAAGTQRSAERQWAEHSRAAYKLRNDLLHSLRYALARGENARQALASLAAISRGSGHADMIQDLTSLSVLARRNSEALAGIGVSPDIARQAATTADEMASLLARATCEKHSVDPLKRTRDQAFSYLKTVVDEVRDCGKFVFHHQPARLCGYISAHRHNINHNSRHKKKPRPQPQPGEPVLTSTSLAGRIN